MENLTPEIEPLSNEAESEKKTGNELTRLLLDTIETILLAAVLFFAINTVSARVRVEGFSMRPTLQNGEYVLVNRMAYKLGQPQRGDIIVFRYPYAANNEEYIKRVIGLPGDKIDIHAGEVKVNGYTLDEPYIAAPPKYNGTWLVEDNHLFVLGDNRNDSSDSHVWGTLDMQYIIGKAILIYWPYQNFSVLHHPQLVPTQ